MVVNMKEIGRMTRESVMEFFFMRKTVSYSSMKDSLLIKNLKAKENLPGKMEECF